MLITLQLFAGIWGAVWGSFLNVLIYRMPLDLSLVRPGSRCSSCLTPIHWYDNIPVLSYLLLKGRCRHCKERYNPRYMLVELACGFLSVVLFRELVFPLDPDTFIQGLFAWLWSQSFVWGLIAITFIDLEHTFIPDELSYPLLGLGIFGAFALPQIDSLSCFFGALTGALSILLLYVVGWIMFRREAMGLGDVKLVAIIGAYLGWEALPFVLFASATQALLITAIVTLLARLLGRKQGLTMTTEELDERFGEEHLYPDHASHMVIPYGPFLALAALEFLLFKGWILAWAEYLGFVVAL